MLKIKSRYPFLLSLVLYCVSLCGQGEMYMQSSIDSVEIGGPVDLTFELRLPSDVKLVSVGLSSFDSTRNELYGVGDIFTDEYLDWAVLPTSAVSVADKAFDLSEIKVGRVNNEQIVKWTASISVYSTGIFKLDHPLVTTVPQINWQRAEPPALVVLPPVSASSTMTIAPIRDIVEESATWQDYWYVILIVGGILLAFLLWYLLARKSQQSQTAEVEYLEPEQLPAHEIALAALQDLERKQLWQKDKIKDYQSELTDIMRAYLSARYDIPAQEQTTRETKHSLKALDLHPRLIDQVLQVLQVADLVKFAKARPDVSIHQQFLDDARQIVIDTAEKSEPS
jgi:hypothetical protein